MPPQVGYMYKINPWNFIVLRKINVANRVKLAENGLEEHDIVIIKLIVAIILRNQHVQHAKNVSVVILISLCLHSP